MKREHEIEPRCVYCANLDDNLNCVVDICYFVLKEATFLSKVWQVKNETNTRNTNTQ